MRARSIYERHCEVLEVAPGAPLEEIEHTFRELIKIWHPDRFIDNPALQLRATRKTTELTRSFQWIRRYDAYIRGQEAHNESTPERIRSALRKSLAAYLDRNPQTSDEMIDRAVRALLAEVAVRPNAPRPSYAMKFLPRLEPMRIWEKIVAHRKPILAWGIFTILFLCFGNR